MIRKTTTATFLALMLLLAGCGGSGSSNSTKEYDDYSSSSFSKSQSYESDYDDVDAGGSVHGGYSPNEVLSQATSEAGGAVDDGASSDSVPEETGESTLPGVSLTAMIRRTANISLSSKKYDEATQSVTVLLKKYSLVTLNDNSTTDGGYYSDSGRRTREIRFRIKSEQFDEFCDAIEAGKDVWDVKEMEKSADDVAKQYNDNAQQIEALKVRYDWYRQRLEQTNDEEVAMEYSDKMFDALEEIKYLENSNKTLETDVAYSVISIYLTENLGTTDEIKKSDNIWEQVGDELSVLPSNLFGALGMFVLIVLRLLPSLLVIAILAIVVLLIIKAGQSYRKKHPRPEPRPRPMPQNPAQAMYNQQMAGAPQGGHPQAGFPVTPQPPVTPRPEGPVIPTAVKDDSQAKVETAPEEPEDVTPASDDEVVEDVNQASDVVVPTVRTPDEDGDADPGDLEDLLGIKDEPAEVKAPTQGDLLDDLLGTNDGLDDESDTRAVPEIDDVFDDGAFDGPEETDDLFSVGLQAENMSVWDDVPDATYTRIEEFGNIRDVDDDLDESEINFD